GAAVDGHARGRDHRVPVVHGLLHPGCLRALMDGGAGVLLSIADGGPAVVLAGLGAVELVAALGTHLDGPQPAMAVERGGLDVAVADGPDLRLRTRRVHVRVVFG